MGFGVNNDPEKVFKDTLARHNDSVQKDKEFKQLVNDLSPLKFRTSKELSAYIVQNNLGHHYPNISGVLDMSNGEDSWKYEGGFPPDIYRRLCIELKLESQHSLARPGSFKSYNQLSKEDDLF
ncbi:hypothetical protein JQC92_01265 [Shewanella sp. 202IG2-18]|uniref:hypothetical protein n=1 Tax=Parashewanella hymeniacidonis TaxID=2807618 RepID=UPI0019606E6A|nr:hypothetical protein [Parashewanella hymeniacidonis]MBM7070672.1 hypothetical protein [Parashewanella hymeniacidonis]